MRRALSRYVLEGPRDEGRSSYQIALAVWRRRDARSVTVRGQLPLQDGGTRGGGSGRVERDSRPTRRVASGDECAEAAEAFVAVVAQLVRIEGAQDGELLEEGAIEQAGRAVVVLMSAAGGLV